MHMDVLSVQQANTLVRIYRRNAMILTQQIKDHGGVMRAPMGVLNDLVAAVNDHNEQVAVLANKLAWREIPEAFTLSPLTLMYYEEIIAAVS